LEGNNYLVSRRLRNYESWLICSLALQWKFVGRGFLILHINITTKSRVSGKVWNKSHTSNTPPNFLHHYLFSFLLLFLHLCTYKWLKKCFSFLKISVY
jgi:hypothetical protein